jgi:hypothetical protein
MSAKLLELAMCAAVENQDAEALRNVACRVRSALLNAQDSAKPALMAVRDAVEAWMEDAATWTKIEIE